MAGYMLPMREARARLTTLPERLADDDEPLVVTRNGRPVLAIMTWDLRESIQETMEIMGDPTAMAAIRRSLEDIEEGKVVPWEEAAAKLGEAEQGPAQ